MPLTEQNNISIAEICFYTLSLFLAIWLSTRHGFGRSAGWFYLIMFSLARIIGASLQLATISQPRNISLYIGAATLANVGLSPLILAQLGLIGRALASIRKSHATFLDEKKLRLVQTIVVVGLILGAVGGNKAASTYGETGTYEAPGESKAGIGLMIAGYILLLLATIVIALQIRLVYAAISTFANNSKFNQLSGNFNIQLGMAIVMEMIVVAIVEGIGLTLKQMPNNPPFTSAATSTSQHMVRPAISR
ncbi:uncharacterized protein BCR38DRAFT_458644 [Pseudomassariella vexata]|uniref:DUF7702 domain-containing protein n=1 Tax=Pseudomassariella vexata TaxID=1141098 RepID=A0A1Y2DW92_9PEZI|nr:uncharacterized protein BCR38DRAFT_458644 [Pseudomassariella vexata]ORY63533.1 hypothetical protein BCR38DRAFT_458644 [Pseudomassariella vexata]